VNPIFVMLLKKEIPNIQHGISANSSLDRKDRITLKFDNITDRNKWVELIRYINKNFSSNKPDKSLLHELDKDKANAEVLVKKSKTPRLVVEYQDGNEWKEIEDKSLEMALRYAFNGYTLRAGYLMPRKRKEIDNE